MGKEKHHYNVTSIPGGHECPYCSQVNTCWFVGGYWEDAGAGWQEHHNTLECDQCGNKHEVVWNEKMALPDTELNRGINWEGDDEQYPGEHRHW